LITSVLFFVERQLGRKLVSRKIGRPKKPPSTPTTCSKLDS